MAKNISSKKTNFAKNRPNCLKATPKRQGVNLQKTQDKNGKTERLSAREIRSLKNAA